MKTIRSAFGKGSGRRSTVLTTLKMAVVAPIPKASASTVTSVNPGLFQSMRKP
jgi:hypothetical protein